MSSQTRRNRLTSRITAIWHSWLSWMRWRQRRETHRRLEQEMLLVRLELLLDREQRLVLDRQRELLWELAIPMLEALGRLDHHQQLTRSRVQLLGEAQKETRNQQETLLLEILQGQQPSAQTQLSPLIGLPTQPVSFPSSAS